MATLRLDYFFRFHGLTSSAMRSLLALCCACVCVFPCAAVTPESWKDTLYSYKGGGATLAGLLTAFSRTMGLELSFQDRKLAEVATMPDATATNPVVFLDRLAIAHKFQWFVYSGVLHVSASGRAVTERLSLGTLTGSTAKQALIGLGLFEQKFGWGELDDTVPIVLLAGPPAYVELVKNVVGKTATEKSIEAPQLMLFRLKYASATDYETSARDHSVSRPGMATLLRGMLTDPPGRGGNKLDDFKDPGPIASARTSSVDPGPSVRFPGLSTSLSTPAGSRRSSFIPSMDAYAPLNAVLVRDFPDKRAMYQELISSLDVPVEQVEILVTIVDADTDKLREWSASLSVGNSLRYGSGSPGVGGADPTIVLWALDKLSLKLRALESEGSAQVISRPSVLTLDNIGAVLDLSQSAFFRLVGERTADLKSVTVGTMLKVTPRVLNDSSDPSIQVMLEIEDGTIKNAGNQGDTPLTERSSISTQAVVRPNQALVIGGYRREQTEALESRVPVLSAIPILGYLFRAQKNGKKERERLFILTARVVGH